jgi:hypothetical protein
LLLLPAPAPAPAAETKKDSNQLPVFSVHQVSVLFSQPPESVGRFTMLTVSVSRSAFMEQEQEQEQEQDQRDPSAGVTTNPRTGF